MQPAPVSWRTMMDARTPIPSPLHLHVVSETRGRALQRCQRCDIPLGSNRCPNPECQEAHGQRAGTLCVWCRDTQQEPLERREVAG